MIYGKHSQAHNIGVNSANEHLGHAVERGIRVVAYDYKLLRGCTGPGFGHPAIGVCRAPLSDGEDNYLVFFTERAKEDLGQETE